MADLAPPSHSGHSGAAGPTIRRFARRPGPGLGLGLLALALAGMAGLWLWQGLPQGSAFIFALRATKLIALVMVGAAIGVATVLFQTVANNRILTPQIMGFDALFGLIQVALVAGLGVSGFAALPAGTTFAFESLAMVAVALVLFTALLGRGARDIPRMILTGVILGVLFRSVGGVIGRMLDPTAFALVQTATAASFSRADPALLPLAGGVTLAALALAMALAPRLDVMALGRNPAVSLGLRYEAMTLWVLALVAVLVAVSTALVGPVVFFGLLVAGLARGLLGTARHHLLIPGAALVGALLLVGGQWLFERALGMQGTLAVVVEFAGGIVFLLLLLKGRIR